MGVSTLTVLYIREFYPLSAVVCFDRKPLKVMASVVHNLVNCHDNNECPKVILRQVGNSIVSYYFRDNDFVYQSNFHPHIFMSYFKPESAPSSSTLGTRSLEVKNCSPMCRYKEFCKNGAIKFCMPVGLLKSSGRNREN